MLAWSLLLGDEVQYLRSAHVSQTFPPNTCARKARMHSIRLSMEYCMKPHGSGLGRVAQQAILPSAGHGNSSPPCVRRRGPYPLYKSSCRYAIRLL